MATMTRSSTTRRGRETLSPLCIPPKSVNEPRHHTARRSLARFRATTLILILVSLPYVAAFQLVPNSRAGPFLVNTEHRLTLLWAQSEPEDERAVSVEEEPFCVSIGKGSKVVTDSLTFARRLQVDGHLTGSVSCTGENADDAAVTLVPDSLVRIGIGGELHADVACVEVIEVFGRLVGNIECLRLTVGSEGEVVGDICSETVKIENGGTVLGIMRCGNAAVDIGDAKSGENVVQESESNSNALVEPYDDTVQEKKHMDEHEKNRIFDLVREAAERKAILELERRNGFVGGLDPDLLEYVSMQDLERGRQIADDIPMSTQTRASTTDQGIDSAFSTDGKPKNPSFDSHQYAVAQGGAERQSSQSHASTTDQGINSSFSTDGKPRNPSYDSHQYAVAQGEAERQSSPEFSPKERFVDDFGNPLLRGASDEDVEMLRRNKEIMKEMREFMDASIQRNKELTMPPPSDGQGQIMKFHQRNNNRLDNGKNGKASDDDDDDEHLNLPRFLR